MAAALWLAVLALGVSGCQASDAPTGAEPSHDRQEERTASPAAPAPEHLVLAREARHLMEEAGDEAWPGWSAAVPPVVVITQDRLHALGTPPIEGKWREVEPGEWEGPPIDGVGPGVQVADGHPFAATLPVDELQQLIDQVVGEGRITLDSSRYIRFVVHEAFHAFQIATLGGELPDFGLTADEREILPELGKADVAAGLAEEARALASGLRADPEAGAIAAVLEFLALRSDRRADLSDDAIALERSLEWTEGLARYADIALTEAAAGDYAPTPEFAATATHPSSGQAEEEHLDWLDDLVAVPGTVRDRYYEVGAAEARLLDRLMPGWQTRALPGGEALESLLEEAVEKADAGITPTLRALERRTISVAGTALDVVVADRPAFWSSGLAGVESLAPLDGVLFAFPEAVEAPFTNRGMTFALDVAFFDEDGTFVDAVAMPACPGGSCDRFDAEGAFRYALEVPAASVPTFGPGDLLEP